MHNILDRYYAQDERVTFGFLRDVTGVWVYDPKSVVTLDSHLEVRSPNGFHYLNADCQSSKKGFWGEF